MRHVLANLLLHSGGVALAAYDMKPHRPDEQTATNVDTRLNILPEPVESRQVRRARERAERKGALHVRP